jgi:PAS domain S-box-containing protein
MKWQHLDVRIASSVPEPEPQPPHLAVGTREIMPIGASAIGATRFSDDLAATGEAAFAIDRRGSILDVNELGAQLVGLSRDALIGHPLATALSIPHAEQIAAYVGTHVRFLPDAALVQIVPDGDREPADVLVCPHDAFASILIVRPGGVRTVALRADDVAQIAHDLKSPLSLIALETDLLDQRLAAGEKVDVRRAVARVLRNVSYLDRMVHDLLDVCSLEAGRLELRKQKTELRTLVESVIDRVIAAGARPRVFLEAPAAAVVNIDDLRIERVIANFLTNAVKYAPSVSGIIVRVEQHEAHVTVSVTDAGPGMTAVEMSYIFDKYRRTRGARGCEGSGLGLYVSKQIIEAHDGVIGVDSVHGAGSRFFFELPR